MEQNKKMSMEELFNILLSRVNNYIPQKNGVFLYEFRTSVGSASSPYNFHATMYLNALPKREVINVEIDRIWNIVRDINDKCSFQDDRDVLQNFLDMYSLEADFSRLDFSKIANDDLLYFVLNQNNSLTIDEMVNNGLVPSKGHGIMAIKKGMIKPLKIDNDFSNQRSVRFKIEDCLALAEKFYGDVWK